MKSHIVLLICTTFLACLNFAFSQLKDDQPNIILIMADDMGYEALSSNGSESCKSPNLDKLATEGVRFTNCFSNPICTPSRAKIMTGQYNVRNYVKFGMLDRGQTTFAHQLKAVGYATAIAGKWQLGNQPDSPQHFGFEKSCLWQHTRGGRSNENGKRIDRRFVNPLLEFNGKEKDFTNGEYGPQVCTDFICDFIDENKKKPFLVYYPMILTHCPFDPTPDSTDWDPKRLGSTTYKGDKNDPQRHFIDMVNFADKMVGQIIKQLEKSGVRENTIVIFTGDNGTDKPIITPWKGTEVVGGKGSMTDNGTRVPLIVNWPAGIKKQGRTVDNLVEFTDMMPTLCEVSGAVLPKNHPADGASFVPVLQNKKEVRKKDWIYIWYRNQVMIRNKKYSLLAKQDGSGATLTRYKGQFNGKELADQKMNKTERRIKEEFEDILARMAKTRLSSASAEGKAMGLKNKSNR
jgi:arylsulfatase A